MDGADQPWLTVTPASGNGSAAITVGVTPVGGVPPNGVAAGSVTISVSGAGNSLPPVSVSLNVRSGGGSAPPIGIVDVPAAGSTLQGSIAVTGWALDDIAVDRVESGATCSRARRRRPFASTPADPRTGKVFIGNAMFVDGARPDIEAVYPTTPLNYRAGWGYLLLTWGLWNQGNGTYTLYAFAFDAEGQVAPLGQKTISVANASATRAVRRRSTRRASAARSAARS